MPSVVNLLFWNRRANYNQTWWNVHWMVLLLIIGTQKKQESQRCQKGVRLFLKVRVMVFNVTFNNISVISWQSVLLAEEIRISGENYQPVTGHWQNDIMLYQVHLAWAGFQLTTLVVIGTDCTGTCKSNYHAYDRDHHGSSIK